MSGQFDGDGNWVEYLDAEVERELCENLGFEMPSFGDAMKLAVIGAGNRFLNAPRSDTRADYAEYLRSPHWIQTRRTALVLAGFRCQRCSRSESLDVHHKTYERRGAERMDDLEVLCRSCHRVEHRGAETSEGRARQW